MQYESYPNPPQHVNHSVFCMFFPFSFVQIGFRMFLGITPTVSKWNDDNSECTLTLDENPLATFVEVPHPLLLHTCVFQHVADIRTAFFFRCPLFSFLPSCNRFIGTIVYASLSSIVHTITVSSQLTTDVYLLRLPPPAQLPASHAKLKFSNIICGVLRGALEMVQMRVECQFVKDTLLGDATTEIRMKLCEILEDQAPPSDD